MDQGSLWIMEIIGPVVLLIVLVWLVVRRRSNWSSSETEAGTRNLYNQVDKRRREGTDDL